MQTIQIDLPDFVDMDTKDILLMIAASLYEKGKLSLGQAADLVGFSKRTFMELLGDYDVSVFNYGIEEIERDFKNA